MSFDKKYETLFDDFYKTGWQHNLELKPEDLLLHGYPYSVDIDLRPGELWLELGVGSGRVVDFHQAKLKDSTCIGVDRSLAALERLKATLPIKIDVLVADIRHLPFKKSAFDLITLFGTIQAYPKHEWLDGVGQLVPLLKPAGKLGFSVHPVSALELIRGMQVPSSYSQLATYRFLRHGIQQRGYTSFKIERHRVYVLLQKLAALFGVKLEHWYGFTEFRNLESNRKLIRIFDVLFSAFSFGHYWIWLHNTEKD